MPFFSKPLNEAFSIYQTTSGEILFAIAGNMVSISCHSLSLLYYNCHSLTFLFGKTLAIPVFIYFQLAGTHTKQISIVRRSINSYTNGLHVINRNESETWKGSVEKTTLYFGKRNGAILIIWHEKRKPINSDDYTALLEDDPTCLCI